jgi:hypothetical protein
MKCFRSSTLLLVPVRASTAAITRPPAAQGKAGGPRQSLTPVRDAAPPYVTLHVLLTCATVGAVYPHATLQSYCCVKAPTPVGAA